MIASGPAGGAYYVNINKARIYGVEVEGSYESDLFFARLAYAYIKGENRLTGAPLTTVPQNTLALTLGSRYEPWNLEYGVRATIADTADYSIAPANPRNPFGGDGLATAWNTVDLFATWKPQEGQFKGWEAQLGIENLFNEDYRRNLATDRSKGRTFKVTLARQFGY
jgi:hemoglobin/transferrin/lactoferrin receptor protein